MRTLNFCCFRQLLPSSNMKRSTYVQSFRIPLKHPRKPQLLDFLLQPRWQTGVHAATTTEHNCPVQTGTHIHISTLDGVEEHFCNSGLIDVDQVRLEETFWGLETLASYPNDSTVGKGVRLNQDGGIFGELLVQLQVVRNIAKLLLDLAHRLEICRTVQGVSTTEKEGDQVPGNIATSNVQTADMVVQDCGFVNGDNVGDTITGINDHTTAKTCRNLVSSSQARSEQDGLP